MQHEHLLQNLSSLLRLALQAVFLQITVFSNSFSALSVGALPIETGNWDGFSTFLCLFENLGLWGDIFSASGSPNIFSDTILRRSSIIFSFVRPVYFLSLPISKQRICRISCRLHGCNNSGAPLGDFAI